MQLIPITDFAPDEWGPSKTKNTTMVKLAATYEIMRPAVIKILTDVTNATGTEARELIDDAKQAVFGGEVMHDICIYAMMLYCWSTHADSAKRDIVHTVIDDYLKTKDKDGHKLLALTKKGTHLNIDDDIEIALQEAWELPGMARLNCKDNGKFTFACIWLDLWIRNSIINMLCFKEREKQEMGEVNRTLNDFLIDSVRRLQTEETSTRNSHESKAQVHEGRRGLQAHADA